MGHIFVTVEDHALGCVPVRGRVLGTVVTVGVTEYRTPSAGQGYLAGEFPGGTTTVEGAPVQAEVRILYRPAAGALGDGVVVAKTQSAPDGTWRVDWLDTALKYDVVGRLEDHNDVIVANVTPTSMVDITYSGAVVENETFTGAVGFLDLVGGIPPYSVAAETPLPSGLFPVVSGRNLIIDGTTEADEVATFDVKVTSSNGAEKIIPLQLVVGFKAPANLKAETVVVDDVFSVSLTWEVTNSTQQIKVYRSESPFDLDDLPEPIATLSGTSTAYTDDAVVEDDYFYYMVTAVCEQYELRSNVIAEKVIDGDPHWENVVALLHFYEGYPFDEKGHLWTFSNSDGFEYVSGMFGTALKNTNMNNRRLFSDLSGYQIVNSDIWTIDIQFSYLNADNVNINGLLMIGNPDSDANRYIQHISDGHMAWWNSRDARNLDIGDHGDGNMRLLSIVRDGSRQLGFVDGVKVFDSNISFPTGASPIFSLFTRRGSAHLNNSMIGVIEQFRMTQGVARYTENFTPPTEPFPNK